MGEANNDLFLSLEKATLDPAISDEKRAALIADDFFEIGKSGKIWNKQTVLEYLSQNKGNLGKIQFHELSAAELAAEAVLVVYRTSIEGDAGGGALRSSIWVRHSGVWQLRFHQATPSQATLGS